MNKKGHSVGAAIASGLTIYYLKDSYFVEAITVGGVVIGSFWPDLDAEYSYIKSKLPIIPNVIEFIQKVLPENNITCHRGALFHSILTLIPFAIFYKVPFVLGMGIGILGHHLLDMTTPAGLRYFYPYKVKVHVWRRIKK